MGRRQEFEWERVTLEAAATCGIAILLRQFMNTIFGAQA